MNKTRVQHEARTRIEMKKEYPMSRYHRRRKTNPERIWLQFMREERNLTFEEAAERIGISFTAYYFIEKGVTSFPRHDVATKIADFFGFEKERFYNL